MSLKVLWRSTVGAKAAPEYMNLLAHGIELRVETDAEAKIDFDWMDVLVDGSPKEAAVDGKNLKHVVVPFVGIRPQLREFMLARPHLKLYNSHFNDAFVAQHAIALMLGVANRILEAHTYMQKGNWKPFSGSSFSSMHLDGKTCLLLGYGAIAKEVQKRVEAFGMRVTAFKRTPDASADIKVYTVEQLYEALAEADVIMVSLPSTPDTLDLLDAEAFKHVKEGSILVNVGRGNVINQHALYEALKTKKLLGAGIDVWWNYPKTDEEKTSTLPADARLHELDNIIMSPHRAASAEDWAATSFKDAVKTLNAIAEGKSRNLVDPNKGY